MAGKPGNRIVVDAERVGQSERTGEILEVIHRGVSVRYRVRWSDGRETMLSPAGGSARILEGGSGGATPAPASHGERSAAVSRAKKTSGKAGKQKAKKVGGAKDRATKKQPKRSGKSKDKRRGGSKGG
jgi:Domain of unknown function (DUF1918)